jgi:hypothetical protein
VAQAQFSRGDRALQTRLHGDLRAIGSPRGCWRSRFPHRMAEDHDVIAKVGRVTGRVAPGQIGEVVIPIRGGSETYHAYAADPGTVFEAGERIVVIEHEPPRTVRIAAI